MDSVDFLRGMVCSLWQVQGSLVSMRLTHEFSAQDEEAYARPVEPGTFAPPQQRFVVKEAIYRPLEFSKILLGPKNCCRLKVCCCITCVLSFILLTLAVLVLIPVAFPWFF